MTPEQYDHWQDFATRAAKTWYATSRRPSVAWVSGVVEDFFDCFDEDDIPCIVNWDNSTPYPPGNRLHGQDNCGRANTPYCAGDMVSVFLDDYSGSPPDCHACNSRYQSHATTDLRGSDACQCEEIENLYYEQWNEQWGSPVHCCIRAGLDLASGPSGGVAGFTAGDIRKMYPEGVPDWIALPGKPWSSRGMGSFWGELVTEPEETFADLPDATPVWL